MQKRSLKLDREVLTADMLPRIEAATTHWCMHTIALTIELTTFEFDEPIDGPPPGGGGSTPAYGCPYHSNQPGGPQC